MSRWRRPILALAVLPALSATAAAQEDVQFDGFSREAEQIVQRMVASVRRISTYSDDGVIRMDSDAAFAASQPDQPASCVYWRPGRFLMKTILTEIACDGRELTVYMKQMRRYKTTDLKEDVARQLAPYWMSTGSPFTIGRLFLSKDPAEVFTKLFRDLEVTGREKIDSVPCVVLEGRSKMPGLPISDEIPVTLWLRERDGIPRLIEMDVSEAMKAGFEDDDSFPGMPAFERMAYVYDLRDQRINEKISAEALDYEPPTGAAKTDQFHSRWMHTADGAARFGLSGKPVPNTPLETLDGEPFDLPSQRGRVIVLSFLPGGMGFRTTAPKTIPKIAEQYRSKKVAVVVVAGGRLSDSTREKLEELGDDVIVVLDSGNDLSEEFDASNSMSTVLIDGEGVVQGRYSGFLGDHVVKLLTADIDTLLAGKQLDSAKAMTPEEIDDLEDQQSAVYFSGGQDADPLNEDWLVERWSVRAVEQSPSFHGQSPPTSDRGFWVRHHKKLMHVGLDGRVIAEIVLDDLEANRFGQDVLVVGRIGRGYGAVHSKPILDERNEQGMRPPKGATLTAYDDRGEQVWTLEIEGQQYQQPRSLTLADLDGRPGDELVFLMMQVLYVVDARGDVAVRYVYNQFPHWLLAEDRDNDGRAEIYLRTQNKLTRLDFRAR